MSFYEELVALGGGLMKGKFMLQGWKNMHPEQHYIQDQIDLYEHIDDPAYLAKEETFESWYENPIDLPGRWYLQVITQLFKENRLAKGEFVGLGRKLDLRDITCPAYLLAGAARRHHHAGAGARRRQVYRNAEGPHRAEDRAGRPYRPVHGRAHAEGGLAADRAMDRRNKLQFLEDMFFRGIAQSPYCLARSAIKRPGMTASGRLEPVSSDKAGLTNLWRIFADAGLAVSGCTVYQTISAFRPWRPSLMRPSPGIPAFSSLPEAAPPAADRPRRAATRRAPPWSRRRGDPSAPW